MSAMRILVTGAAGFIGFHTAKYLLEHFDCEVLGIDVLSHYYSVSLKRARLAILESHPRFTFCKMDFVNRETLETVFERFKPNHVLHLGAQAGVRYSLENPEAYTHNNISGFLSVLEACRRFRPDHLVFASSSSVYGLGSRAPFSEDQSADQPVSFYAATKRANELMAHSYAHLHGLNITGVRFFTVYGPWGRPDMTPMLFADAICNGSPVMLFNRGRNLRDFTYIDDIVSGVVKIIFHFDKNALPHYRVLNLGHNRPVELRAFLGILESKLGTKACIELRPPEPGDMVETCADLTRVRETVGYEPRISLEEGTERFVKWFMQYNGDRIQK